MGHTTRVLCMLVLLLLLLPLQPDPRAVLQLGFIGMPRTYNGLVSWVSGKHQLLESGGSGVPSEAAGSTRANLSMLYC